MTHLYNQQMNTNSQYLIFVLLGGSMCISKIGFLFLHSKEMVTFNSKVESKGSRVKLAM